MGIGTHADNKLGHTREEQPGGGILREILVLSQHKKLWTIVKVGRFGAAAEEEGETETREEAQDCHTSKMGGTEACHYKQGRLRK